MHASVAANGVIAALVLGWLLLMSARAVTVDVTPHVALAPAFVRVLVRVRPNTENRGLYVEADGQEYRSSFVQLDGDHAPVSYWIDWAALPAGDYDVRAAVASNVRVLARDHTTLIVVGPGE